MPLSKKTPKSSVKKSVRIAANSVTRHRRGGRKSTPMPKKKLSPIEVTPVRRSARLSTSSTPMNNKSIKFTPNRYLPDLTEEDLVDNVKELPCDEE